MDPVGQAGSVEEVANTVVDGMRLMDGGGDDVDGMGDAGGELDVVA